MNPGQAALLGLVQGVTEFLPVSSSGHLVLAQAWLGVDAPGLTFEVLVHFGTLMAIFIVFRSQIALLADALVRLPGFIMRGRWRDAARDRGVRLLVLIGLGSIPAGAAGFWLRHAIGELFADVQMTGLMLLLTGGLLWAAARVREGATSFDAMAPGQAVLIGVFQALALLPGISRSGATIASGLYSGLDREAAGSFSFLLAIPAILGATLLELREMLVVGPDLPLASALIGVAAAGVSGYFSLRLLLRFVRAGKLHWFSYYVWAVGALVLISGIR